MSFNKLDSCKNRFVQIELNFLMLQKHIFFSYTSTYESLINELLNLNRYAVIPSVLLIGDIDHFIESSTQTETREMLACKLYATISYIMNICSKLLKNKTFFCGTLEGDVDKNQTFSEMYFDRFWTICDTDEMVHLKMLTNANHESYRFQKLDNESLVLKEIVKQVVNS